MSYALNRLYIVSQSILYILRWLKTFIYIAYEYWTPSQQLCKTHCIFILSFVVLFLLFFAFLFIDFRCCCFSTHFCSIQKESFINVCVYTHMYDLCTINYVLLLLNTMSRLERSPSSSISCTTTSAFMRSYGMRTTNVRAHSDRIVLNVCLCVHLSTRKKLKIKK